MLSPFFRSITTILVIISLITSLSSCSAVNATTSLKRHLDTTDGYEFLYPLGWVEVSVKSGADIVYHDLIETSENVSVIINPTKSAKTLADLGNPSEVGYKLQQKAIDQDDAGRQAKLLKAGQLSKEGQNYYILEYEITLPNKQKRHDIVSVAVSRGKLYTFNASTSANRWNKMKPLLENVVTSFKVY